MLGLAWPGFHHASMRRDWGGQSKGVERSKVTAPKSKLVKEGRGDRELVELRDWRSPRSESAVSGRT